jgi:hypothetical protein
MQSSVVKNTRIDHDTLAFLLLELPHILLCIWPRIATLQIEFFSSTEAKKKHERRLDVTLFVMHCCL